jgi:ABC-2 type transport system permease protein
MQVYRLFFKILRTQIGQAIMYIGIFIGVLSIVSSQQGGETNNTFKMSSLKVAVNDLDNTSASKALQEFLQKDNEIAEIADFDKETIQDELYNRNISAAVTIPEGYEKNLSDRHFDNIIDVYTLPGTMTADIITNEIDSYMSNVAVLINTGSNTADALSMADKISGTRTDVNILEKDSSSDKGITNYFFSYIAYIGLCIIFVGALPVLMVINKDNIRSRIGCSSYKLAGINTESFLGLITFGGIICVIFSIFSVIYLKSKVLSINGVLYILNMLVYIILAAALAFFIGQLIKKVNMISIIANILGLGFSFLGGVFVPLSVMDEGVIRIAHFLPSYWYVLACDFIENFTSGDSIAELIQYMGIQLAFAIIFLFAGVITIKAKQKA